MRSFATIYSQRGRAIWRPELSQQQGFLPLISRSSGALASSRASRWPIAFVPSTYTPCLIVVAKQA
jgi:hypothetical protein